MTTAKSCGENPRSRDSRRAGNLGASDDKDIFFAQSKQLPVQRGEMQRCGGEKEADCVPDWQHQISSCPVFHPSKEEFEDPLQYIRSIAPQASKYGICKIVSPLVASVSAATVLSKEKSNFKFTTRVQPMRLANWDSKDHITFLISGRAYTFHDFEKMANKAAFRKYQTTGDLPPKFIEAEFWREMAAGKNQTVEYACDIEGSAFSSSSTDPLGTSRWNLKVLPYLSQSILRLLQNAIPGVTDPMLYIGMLFSMFAWHVEDHYLYSINYLHCGAPKTWYGVPGHAASDFERVARDTVYDPAMLAEKGEGAAYELLIGKTTLFSPKLLCDNQIPVYRGVQGPGEFVITFPRAYHAGFSHGFNCGEAVNFAMVDWLPFGAAACKRYGLLNRLPLLPHEELLCQEAMHCFEIQRSASGNLESANGVSLGGDEHQKCLKASFVKHMRFQHKIRWFLKQNSARLIISPEFHGSELCSLCKHMCYVAYITCSCVQLPFCLKHAKEIRECNCGSKRLVRIKASLSEMERVARKFEKEEGVMEELCREPAIIDMTPISGAVLEDSMFSCDDLKAYVWDLDIKEDQLFSPQVSGPDLQGNDSSKAPLKRYSSVSVIVNKSSSNLQSFSRATRALGSLNCVPHFGTPVQAVPVEVLSPDDVDLLQQQSTGTLVPDDSSQQPVQSETAATPTKKCACPKDSHLPCYCSSPARDMSLPAVKRKRSGLNLRQVRAWGDEHPKKLESSHELRSFPAGSTGPCSNDEGDEDEDGAHAVKRQRMASLDKLRSDGDHGNPTMRIPPCMPPVRVIKPERLGRQSKKGPIRLWATPEGDLVLLLADIIRELHIKRALLEVVSLWQSKARKVLAELNFLYIHPAHLPSSKKHPALTLKGCQCVKSFLSQQDSLKMQNLIQDTFGKQESALADRKLSPKESSNDLGDQCLQKRQGEVGLSEKTSSNPADNLVNVHVHSASEEVPGVLKLKRKQGRLKYTQKNPRLNVKIQKGFKHAETTVSLYGSKVNAKQIPRQGFLKAGGTRQPEFSQRSICLNEFSATSGGERFRKKKLEPDHALENRCTAAFKRLKTVRNVNATSPSVPEDAETGTEKSPEGLNIRCKDVPKVGRIKVKGPSMEPSMQVPPSSSDGTAQNSNTCCLKKSALSSLEGVDEGSTGSVVCRNQCPLPELNTGGAEVAVKRKRGRPRKNRPVEEVPGSRQMVTRKVVVQELVEEKPSTNQVVKSRFAEEMLPECLDHFPSIAHKVENGNLYESSVLNCDPIRAIGSGDQLLPNGRDVSSNGSDMLDVQDVVYTEATDKKEVLERTGDHSQVSNKDPRENDKPISTGEGRLENESTVVEVTISHVENAAQMPVATRKDDSQCAKLLQVAGSSAVDADGCRVAPKTMNNYCGVKPDGLVEVPINEHCGERATGGDSSRFKDTVCGSPTEVLAIGNGSLKQEQKEMDVCVEVVEKSAVSDSPRVEQSVHMASSVITCNGGSANMSTDVVSEQGQEPPLAFDGNQGQQSSVGEKCPPIQLSSSVQPTSKQPGGGILVCEHEMDYLNPCTTKSRAITLKDADGPLFCVEGSSQDISMDSMLRGMPLLTESLDLPNLEFFSGELSQFSSLGSRNHWRGFNRIGSSHSDELSEAWKSGNSQAPPNGGCNGGSLQSGPLNGGIAGLQTSQESQAVEMECSEWRKGASEVTNELLSAASHYAKVSSTNQSSCRGLSRKLPLGSPSSSGVRVPMDSILQGHPHVLQSSSPVWPQLNREFVRDFKSNGRECEPGYLEHGQSVANRNLGWSDTGYDVQSSYIAQNQLHAAQASDGPGSILYADRSVFNPSYIQQPQTALLSGFWGNVGGFEGHVLAARLESLVQQARLGQWGSNNANLHRDVMGPSSRMGHIQQSGLPNLGGHGISRVQSDQSESSQMGQWPTIPNFSGNPPASSLSGLPPLPNTIGNRAAPHYRGQVQCSLPASEMHRLPLPQSYQMGGSVPGMSQLSKGPGVGVQSASMHRYEETRITNQVAHQGESTWQMGNQKVIEVTHRFVL